MPQLSADPLAGICNESYLFKRIIFENGGNMKHSITFVFIFFCIAGCKKESITENQNSISAFPRVAISDKNYSSSDFNHSFPDSTYLDLFTTSYAGKYSNELKGQLVSYIQEKVNELGANRQEFNSCLQATKQLSSSIISLPMEAERTKYEGQSCWIFSFIWGMDSNDLMHYRCFVIGVTSHDILASNSCF